MSERIGERIGRPEGGDRREAGGGGFAAMAALALAALGLGVLAAPEPTVAAMLGLGLGAPLAALVWARPELGLLGLLFLTSNFIPADIVELRLPIGGLDTRDLALLGMLGMLAAQAFLGRRRLSFWWPVGLPLLLLLALAFCSALYAMRVHGVEANWTLGELRTLMYFAVFVVASWALAGRRELVVVMLGLFAMTDIIALILILQQFLGAKNPVLAVMMGNTWLVWEAGGGGDLFGEVRVIPPGHLLMYVMSVVAYSLAAYGAQPRGWRAFFLFQLVWLNVSLLFTYTRAQWLASALAIVLVTALTARADQGRIARAAGAAGAALLAGNALFGATVGDQLSESSFAALLSERVMSIFTPSETLDSYSIEWRIFETGAALESIRRHPVFGVGLGNMYREPTLLHGEASEGYFRLTRFIHNSYLYLAVKLGLAGLLAFAWMALAFLAGGWRAYRAQPDGHYRRVTLALLASLIGALAWSVTQSHLLQAESTAVIGLMFAAVYRMRQSGRRSP